MNKTIVNNIRICLDTVKAINTTASQKAGYFTIYYNIKKAFDFCYDMTRCGLFDINCCLDMYELRIAVNTDFEGVTKKQLDKLCKRSLSYLEYQLSELYSHYTILV